MREADFEAFGDLLDAVCGLLSRGQYTPSGMNTALWFRALAAHDLATVRRAFDAHVKDPQRGRFVPVPADILAQIEGAAADDGRPGPEEAWALAIKARDESATVVWTEEAAQAWELARGVLQLGDEVGARVAFREAYQRAVTAAREVRRPVAWSVSLGFDAEARGVALRAAVQAGRLAAPEAEALLPGPVRTFGPPPEVRAVLQALRDRIVSDGQAEASAVDRAREELARRKSEAQSKVDGYVARGAA